MGSKSCLGPLQFEKDRNSDWISISKIHGFFQHSQWKHSDKLLFTYSSPIYTVSKAIIVQYASSYSFSECDIGSMKLT